MKKSVFAHLSLIILGATSPAFAIDTMLASKLSQELSKEPFFTQQQSSTVTSYQPKQGLRGWDHAFKILSTKGIDPKHLEAILSDPRLPRHEPLIFSLNPRESHYPYRKLNTKRNRANALNFYRKHRTDFLRAEAEFNVPASVILSILQVETYCGKNTGKRPTFHGLLRLANATDAESLEATYRRRKAENPNVTREAVYQRAKYLEDTFMPHVVAAIILASRSNLSPLDLRGSGAGALGIPQFLPGNVLAYGVDGDRNGRVDIFTPADAINSVAKFLAHHGWSSAQMTSSAKRQAIWHYNRSEPYISTVLAMAEMLRTSMRQS